MYHSFDWKSRSSHEISPLAKVWSSLFVWTLHLFVGIAQPLCYAVQPVFPLLPSHTTTLTGLLSASYMHALQPCFHCTKCIALDHADLILSASVYSPHIYVQDRALGMQKDVAGAGLGQQPCPEQHLPTTPSRKEQGQAEPKDS